MLLSYLTGVHDRPGCVRFGSRRCVSLIAMSSTNTMRLTKSKPNFSSFHGSSLTFNNSPMPLDLGTLPFLGAFPKFWTTTFGQLREAADGLKESVTLAASCARFCRWKACQSRSSANRPVLRALLRRDHTEQCEKRPVHSFTATVRIFQYEC